MLTYLFLGKRAENSDRQEVMTAHEEKSEICLFEKIFICLLHHRNPEGEMSFLLFYDPSLSALLVYYNT